MLKIVTLTLAGIIGNLSQQAMAQPSFMHANGVVPTANAREGIRPPYLTKHDEPEILPVQQPTLSTARTTALGSRLIARVFKFYNGTDFVVSDSSRFTFSGGRGGDLNSDLIKYDELKSYDLSSGSLKNSTHATQTFDAAGNIAVQTVQYWNTGSSSFLNAYLVSYTFTAFGREATRLMQQWNGSAWENAYNVVSSYTPTKKLKEFMVQDWDGSGWSNERQEAYTYTASYKAATYTYKTWNSGLSKWDTSAYSSYIYDALGNLVIESGLSRNAATGTLENSSRVTYAYDATGHQTREETQNWDPFSNSWQNASSRAFQYDHKGNITETVSFRPPTGGRPDTIEHTLYTYNSYDQLLTETREHWDSMRGWFAEADNDYYLNYYYEEFTNSVKETIPAAAVLLYPVPAQNVLRLAVQLTSTESFTLSLTDLQGRVVQNRPIAATAQINETINVSTLPAGNYLLQLKGDRGASLVRQVTVAH